ncbi:unnamed protein product [Adineta ricciae]|uniref:Threonylcarbamoyl-AMP synthase n=2 Tax=Adineta ricciae TaxID=249248 RepID=A0A813P0A4_ADIRI|nr:unnamed protein product [Adineta ricciae]
MSSNVTSVNESDLIDRCMTILKHDGVLAVPTDTIYGLAALVSSEKAVRRIYEIKGRLFTKPLAISVGNVEDLFTWSKPTLSSKQLSDGNLLPGPVTLMFERQLALPSYFNPNVNNVAIRIPNHQMMIELARRLDEPIALTSANISNGPSSVSIDEFQSLWSQVDLVIDGGVLASNDRRGSTIVDLCEKGYFHIQRQGINCERIIMSLSKLESLANETILEIFDYLRPIDIIRAFELLNERFQILIIQRSYHVNLSMNLSLNDFNEYCSIILPNYCSSIHSIYLSNSETCGCMSLFFQRFPHVEAIFPNLRTMIFIDPNDNDYSQIIKIKQLTTVHLKFSQVYEQKIHLAALFDNPNLQTCILSYDDLLPIQKFRSNSSLKRLVLDNFYINDFHLLFYLYPSLEHLAINRLLVNFHGYLPPFNGPVRTLHTLKLNCAYTVQFDYIMYLLSFLPNLVRFTLIAIGMDFFNAEQWIQILSSLEQLRSLVFDLKAVPEMFDNKLASSFLTPYWHRWRIAVDYSEDNRKYHLFTIPYHRISFISTIYSVSTIEAPPHTFDSVTHLYLKMNTPVQMCSNRKYPNVYALQIYQNTIITVDYTNLFSRLCTMIDTNKLVHLELFVSLPPSIFLALLKSTPCLRYFKTDYEILMILTDNLQNDDICSELHNKLNKLVIRQGVLPLADKDRFAQIFSNLKYLQIHLYTVYELRLLLWTFMKIMFQLQTLHVRLIGTDASIDSLQWQGVINNISYEIAKRHIQIWK